jgi:2,7-dihydroxy-5-methyl-1-naphthoate 7-O-methyltransferase
MPAMSRGNPPNLWELSDLCTPWCIHVVATLRIADRIAAGTTGIQDLARASGADADSLHRVLQHLVGKGVFEEPSPGQMALNEPSRALLESSVHLGLDLDGIGGRMAYAWSSLLRAVRSGNPAYHEVFGRPFWEDLDEHPDVAASFDALMGPAGHGFPDPDVLIAGDWDSVHTVVDVGGGTGTLLAGILRAHLNVRGILVDLPRTIARSAETFETANVADRVTTHAGSFFDPLPAGGDLYLLKSVLSDWPDEQARVILRRCAEAAQPHGRVVMLNGVTPDDRGAPPPDLLMMVLVGGRNRTLSEFRALAHGAGLVVHAAAVQRSGRFLVECRAAGQP